MSKLSVINCIVKHLSLSQQNDVLTVLDEFAVCFSEQPGLYTGIEHCIDITTQILWAVIEKEAYAIVLAF